RVAFFLEGARHRLPRAMRIEPAGIHDEFYTTRGGEGPQLEQHRDNVARVAGARVALAILLQDRQRQFGKMIRRDVLDAAAFDRGAHRVPGIAVKAEPGANADRFHGETVGARLAKSKCLVRSSRGTASSSAKADDPVVGEACGFANACVYWMPRLRGA